MLRLNRLAEVDLSRAATTAKPWLILPIESNIRELHARMLLAAVAAERGFGVIVGRAAEIGRYVPGLPPGVLLRTSVIGKQITESARRHGHVVTALDEEGLVVRDTQDYLDRRISVSALEDCSRFFAWGEVHRDAVISRAPHLAARVIAVGNPRIDLLRPEIRKIFRSETEQVRQRYGRFVMINSNLGTYNHQLGAQARVREWKLQGWSDTAEGAALLQRTLAFQEGVFVAFEDLIGRLSETLPSDVGLIVRPHPAERLDTWERRLRHLDRVTVVREGGVLPWLLAAEALIHNSCTTGIEAALLGLPAYAYLVPRDEAVECELPNQVSRRYEDRELLVQAVAKTVDRSDLEPAPISMRAISSHISNLQGPLSCETIVDELHKVAPPAERLRQVAMLPARIRWGRASLRARSFISGVRRGTLQEERDTAAYFSRASPGIRPAELSHILAGLSVATGRFSATACTRLGPDLVLVA